MTFTAIAVGGIEAAKNHIPISMLAPAMPDAFAKNCISIVFSSIDGGMRFELVVTVDGSLVWDFSPVGCS